MKHDHPGLPHPFALPLPASILNGQILFFTARGKISTQNTIACASCHPDAAHDGRNWIFTNTVDEGNRKTTDIRGIVDSGAVHWTANMDELQNLEWNIRKINFGAGLIDGLPSDALAPEPNAGRSQGLDDMAAYMDSLLAPVSINPVTVRAMTLSRSVHSPCHSPRHGTVTVCAMAWSRSVVPDLGSGDTRTGAL